MLVDYFDKFDFKTEKPEYTGAHYCVLVVKFKVLCYLISLSLEIERLSGLKHQIFTEKVYISDVTCGNKYSVTSHGNWEFLEDYNNVYKIALFI